MWVLGISGEAQDVSHNLKKCTPSMAVATSEMKCRQIEMTNDRRNEVPNEERMCSVMNGLPPTNVCVRVDSKGQRACPRRAAPQNHNLEPRRAEGCSREKESHR